MIVQTDFRSTVTQLASKLPPSNSKRQFFWKLKLHVSLNLTMVYYIPACVEKRWSVNASIRLTQFSLRTRHSVGPDNISVKQLSNPVDEGHLRIQSMITQNCGLAKTSTCVWAAPQFAKHSQRLPTTSNPGTESYHTVIDVLPVWW